MKPGKLNFLETSGPVQACNGIALHLLQRQSVVLYQEYHTPELTFSYEDYCANIGQNTGLTGRDSNLQLWDNDHGGIF